MTLVDRLINGMHRLRFFVSHQRTELQFVRRRQSSGVGCAVDISGLLLLRKRAATIQRNTRLRAVTRAGLSIANGREAQRHYERSRLNGAPSWLGFYTEAELAADIGLASAHMVSG